MSTGLAILFSIGLVFLCGIIANVTGFLVIVPMVLGTAIWAAVDASKIELKKYKTGLAKSPAGIFCVILLLWIVAFPWYLSVKGKIRTGKAELEDKYKGETQTPPSLDV